MCVRAVPAGGVRWPASWSCGCSWWSWTRQESSQLSRFFLLKTCAQEGSSSSDRYHGALVSSLELEPFCIITLIMWTAISMGNKFWRLLQSSHVNLYLPGSVPSGPGGSAFCTRLWHHAPHCHLHPLCVHWRRQGSTGASLQRQRITMGEEET